MPELTNAQVADTLDQYARLLELAGEGPFRVRAYQRAAEAIRFLTEPISTVYREGRLQHIPGIGSGIAAALGELLDTGEYGPLVQLQNEVPLSVLDLLAIPGVGVKTAARLFRELEIRDLPGLEEAIAAGRLRNLPGLGAKTEAKIVAGLESLKRRTGRLRLGRGLPAARQMANAIAAVLPGHEVAIAGSIRRMEATVADLDLIVAADDQKAAIIQIEELPLVTQTVERRPDLVRLALTNGLLADVVVVPPAQFGSGLIAATGSPAHLAALGVPVPPAATEIAAYAAMGLAWIAPELRQGRNEVELARAGRLPDMVGVADIRGEFHCHTTWSDGSASVAEMAAAAASHGYTFLAISDHSRSLGVANGLDVARLAAQRAVIDDLNRRSRIRILAGAEVEVSRDGNLDYDDATLAGLDVVIASLHVGLRQPRQELTDRLIRVLENPNVDIIAHPSGRLIEQREGGDFDWDRVFTVAARTGTALEINADPARLDLSGDLARRALEAGCLLTINCDAHSPDGFNLIEYGIGTARRAGATPDRILNTWNLERVLAWLGSRGQGPSG